MRFREWPARRILLLSVGWIVAILALPAWQVFKAFAAIRVTGSGGVGAVSVGLLELLEFVAILFCPPLAFGFLWLVLRRCASGDT